MTERCSGSTGLIEVLVDPNSDQSTTSPCLPDSNDSISDPDILMISKVTKATGSGVPRLVQAVDMEPDSDDSDDLIITSAKPLFLPELHDSDDENAGETVFTSPDDSRTPPPKKSKAKKPNGTSAKGKRAYRPWTVEEVGTIAAHDPKQSLISCTLQLLKLQNLPRAGPSNSVARGVLDALKEELGREKGSINNKLDKLRLVPLNSKS